MNKSLTGALVLGGIILLNAFLKMSYVALINAQKSRLKEMAEDGNLRAGQAYRLANDASRLLASQQIADLLLRFVIALVASVTFAPALRDELLHQGMDNTLANSLGYGVVILLTTVITLLFGEMLPSNIAVGHAETIAIWSAGTINMLAHGLAPMLRLLQWVSGQFAAPFVGHTNSAMVTEEEIKMLVDAGSEDGVIEDEEKEMIFSIFQLGDTLAREVMVPRIDLVALDSETPFDQALSKIIEAGHSRIPIYEENIDHIKGLLYAKDLLVYLRDGDRNRPIKDMLRPAYFVPESKKAVDLLAELQQRKVHLAVVVDEYGGTAGLVTLEDLIEEIVGDIRDEYDFNEEEDYQQVTENEYIVDAGMDIDDINRLLDINLPTDESDTLGGYIFSTLGKVPVEGEQIEDEHIAMEVLNIVDRRIRKIRVVRKPSLVELEDSREEPAAAPD